MILRILFAILLSAMIGCGGSEPESYTPKSKGPPVIVLMTPTPIFTPIPTPAYTPTPAASVSPSPVSARTVTRQAVRSVFERAGFEFTGHGELSPDWYTGNIWDGSGVSIDIFGPAHKIEAVEVWFRINTAQDSGVGFAMSVARLISIIDENDVKKVASWMADKMPELPDAGKDGFIRHFGRFSCQLQITSDLNQVLLSVEPK